MVLRLGTGGGQGRHVRVRRHADVRIWLFSMRRSAAFASVNSEGQQDVDSIEQNGAVDHQHIQAI